jgi:hypothetical protein
MKVSEKRYVQKHIAVENDASWCHAECTVYCGVRGVKCGCKSTVNQFSNIGYIERCCLKGKDGGIAKVLFWISQRMLHPFLP